MNIITTCPACGSEITIKKLPHTCAICGARLVIEYQAVRPGFIFEQRQPIIIPSALFS